MNTRFAKYECMGNDFGVVNETQHAKRWTARRVSMLCDRRRGVGVDGLILLQHAGRRRFRFRLFNSDGSRAEWSGNGVRCAAAYIADNIHLQRMTIVTDAGPIPVVCAPKGRGGTQVILVCPVPSVLPRPVHSAIRIRNARGPFAVDAGNPHWVYLVSNFDFPWERAGTRCQAAAGRTRGVNVEFTRIDARDRLELRLFERGVGTTPSSGSGALAAAALCWKKNLIGIRVRVGSPGGSQLLYHNTEHQTVRLTATARFVFAGTWSLT